MLLLSDEEIEKLNFDEKYNVMTVLQNIAHNSGNQENISANLKKLKHAADQRGKSEEFNNVFDTRV